MRIMTTNEAKEVLNGIKSYENTRDLIENHSVSVQDACTIGINAIDKVEKYKKAIEVIRAEILSLKGDNFPNDFYVRIIDKYIKEVES